MAQPPQQVPHSFQTLDRAQRAPYPRREYIRKTLWSVVNLTVWKFPRAWGWRRFLLRLFGATVGNRAIFLATTKVMHPWLLEIGEYSTVGPGVTIYNLGRVTIGAHTVISQDSYICAGTHDYTVSYLPLQRVGIVIGTGVWIAARAFVGPGVRIGDNSVIGACAVVARDIPEAVVVAGNPARVLKPRVMNETPEASLADQ